MMRAIATTPEPGSIRLDAPTARSVVHALTVLLDRAVPRRSIPRGDELPPEWFKYPPI